jgi:hypothetical protein
MCPNSALILQPVQVFVSLAGRRRNSCIEAGCSCHLSKPISKKKPLGVIEDSRQMLGSANGREVESPQSIGIEMPTDLEEIVPGYLGAPGNISMVSLVDVPHIPFAISAESDRSIVGKEAPVVTGLILGLQLQSP